MSDRDQIIRPKKLSDEVEDRLLALIRADDLKPGDALPSERALMARYGIGRPAIALRSRLQIFLVKSLQIFESAAQFKSLIERHVK